MQNLFGVTGHDGLDYAMPVGTPIFTSDKGEVILAGKGDYGLTVVIQHSWGQSYYGHLSQISVTVGDTLARGESLGLSGNTGISTAPHLHFGVKPTATNNHNGYFGFVDPLPYLTDGQALGESESKSFVTVNRKSKFRLDKHTLRADEHALMLTFTTPQERNLNFKLTNPKGITTDITSQVLGSTYGPLASNLLVELDPVLAKVPGTYSLTLTDGSGFYDQQDFTWGVLAINSDKAVYKPGDTAELSIGVLDEYGKMVCDADLTLQITDPLGQVKYLKTGDGITVNTDVCSSYEFTLAPDYQTSFTVSEIGAYQLELSAVTRTGSYTITSQFQVETSPAFTVARSSATRLYPAHLYPMVIQVTPASDYQGLVTEKVPADFSIQTIDQSQIKSFDNITGGTEQVLSWNVDWRAGETYYLGYSYDAPDSSPAFYKLGPLTLGNYIEPRSWSLAIDAITYQTAGSANMTGANVTTISPDYPPSIAAGDLLVLMIGMKPSVANSGSVTTPSGWTAITGGSATGGGYSTTLGADTGNTHVFSYYRIADGTEGKTPLTVSLTNRNITVAQMFRLSGNSGSWDLAATTGEDTDGSTGSVSVAFGSDPGVTSGDYILGMYTIPTDATSNFTAHALTQTGVTFGTVTEVGDSETANGNDFGYTFWRAAVSSGTSSANPTYTATVGTTVTNGRGPGLFIRAREVAAPGVPTLAPDDGGSNQIVFSNNRQFDATPIVRAQATYGSTFDRFQVEFNTASDFTGTAYTETFSGTYSSATNYNLQTTGALSLPTTNGVTYYGRVRASADSGSHYGAWSSTLWTFTYKSSGDNDWHQTTDVQFNSDTLGNTTETNGSGAVQLATGYPEVKGWTSGSSASTSNSLTLYKPSGVQVNDLLIIIVGNDNTTATDQWDNTTYKPSGFTLINETGDTASDTHTGAFYRVADGTEASTIAVPAQSTMNYWGFYIRVVGASTSTPIDVTGVDVNSTAAATSLALTGVTTTVNNVLAFYASSYDGADGDPFGVTGTGWSETAEAESHAGTITAEANGSSGSWGTLQQATAGATGNATVTATISDTFAGFTFGIRPNNPTSGTIMSTEIDYDWVDGATSWGSLAFSTTETAGDVKLKLYYTASTACDTIVPDGALANNSTGFDVSASPISITSLNTTTYNKICLQATLTDSGGTPTLNDWSVTWNVPTPITISGTANGNSGASIRYAYDGVLQSDTSDTISGGTWSIDNVTSPSVNQVITVWVDNVTDANESTAVTKWSSGNITGMLLDTNVVSVGSSQNTSLTVTNLDSYDCTADEDIMYQAGTSHLKVEGDSCAGGATNSYSAEEIEILSGDTLTIGTSETLTTYDLTITGTLTSSGNSTYNVSHNWAKAGTFTESTSTVNLNGGGGTTQTITGTNTFYTLSATGSSARTIKFPSSVTTTVSNSLTLSGTSSQLLTLDPGTASTTWTISAPATTSVSYVSVSYSTNSGTSFCATYSTDGGNNTSWNITTTATCPVPASSANSFQRKTWWDGTRYWRSYQNTTDNRIEFEYSTDGSSWTENTGARISVDTDDFSIYADSSNAFIVYTNGYDIEARKAATYPGTSFTWGSSTIVYDGSSTTDYYRYPTLAYDSNSKIWASASFYNTGSVTNQAIAASTDDAHIDLQGNYTDSNASNFMGGLTTGTVTSNYIGGFRFTSLQIPPKAIISSAAADWQNNWTGSYGNEKARIYAEAADDAATFSAGSTPSSRSTTTNYVDWTGTTESLSSGTWFSATSNWQPPSIVNPIQEVVDRSGWSKGNDIAVIVKTHPSGTDSYYFTSFSQDDTGSGNEPRISISWTASQIMAVQASSANDITAWGTTSILDSSTNTNKYGVIVPRASGSVYASWIDGTAIEGKNFNGTSWDTNATSIDTGLSGLTKNISAVSDSSGNVYLTYVDDETTDQISARSFNGTSWSAQALVPDAADANDSYVTLSYDSNGGDLYAFWIDTSSGYIYYSSCDVSTNCDAASEWSAETAWQTTGTNKYPSSSYSYAGKVFAQWADGTTLTWDKLSLGGNTAPNNPSSLAQKTTGDVTLATGDWVSATSIKFTATATDTDNPDTLYLCVEKDILGTSFSNTEDSCGTGVAYSGSGVTVSVTISSQTDASEYHWQARVKDSAGEYSSWVSYDVNAESARDYGLDTTAPTGGTVYDGTSIGVDAAYNDNSLSSLSANWASFDSNASGLNKYQYSIGTSAGGTDIKGWTDNSTTTSVTTSSLTLNSSAVYYFNVRAIDNAGNTGNAVSSNGQRVAPSLSFSVSPATVAFANLNSGNSYTDSKTSTLTTSTNAYNGYVIRAFVTDYLRSTVGSFTIPDFTGGTYASPAVWGSSTGFGYTSSDTTIGGADKFGSGTLYAPFSHTGPGDIVADHTSAVSGTPISNEQFTLTYKVTAPTLQEAKNYTTTVVYTATAQY